MPDDKPKRAVLQIRLTERDSIDIATVTQFHNQNATSAIRLLVASEARRIRAGAIATEPKARRPRADNPDKIPG